MNSKSRLQLINRLATVRAEIFEHRGRVAVLKESENFLIEKLKTIDRQSTPTHHFDVV